MPEYYVHSTDIREPDIGGGSQKQQAADPHSVVVEKPQDSLIDDEHRGKEKRLTISDVMAALVYSRGTSRVVNGKGSGAIAMKPEGELYVYHDIEYKDLIKVGVVISTKIAAVPGPHGLIFGTVSTIDSGRYYVKWEDCGRSTCGNLLDPTDLVG